MDGVLRNNTHYLRFVCFLSSIDVEGYVNSSRSGPSGTIRFGRARTFSAHEEALALKGVFFSLFRSKRGI
jgi:hypothetical protein